MKLRVNLLIAPKHAIILDHNWLTTNLIHISVFNLSFVYCYIQIAKRAFPNDVIEMPDFESNCYILLCYVRLAHK